MTHEQIIAEYRRYKAATSKSERERILAEQAQVVPFVFVPDQPSPFYTLHWTRVVGHPMWVRHSLRRIELARAA